ncbi:glycosyltransferase [Clostridium butyricum]|uniref:glycosyltransferase n=1 Tax=Clostridium butyricum TaxID=1492 RepID=UPI00374F8D38
MNNNKIAFITCVKNQEIYMESLKYINNLIIPDGYEIDIISINEADCIASAYNEAIKDTNAKYKVYLNENTYIVNKNFIYDILELFGKDSKIGMIGVIGTKLAPINGLLNEVESKYGKIYRNDSTSMKLLEFNEVNNEYEEVIAIDGLIMITQYDVKWRNDLFKGWDFYDTSQSIEFILAGYKVVLPNQNKPWCLNEFEKNNSNFRESEMICFNNIYSKIIYPKVSLIAIDCCRNQIEDIIQNNEYKNMEYINLSDNIYSISKVKDNIWNNSKDKYNNLVQVINDCTGEYIIFMENNCTCSGEKIQKMIEYSLENKESSIVCCQRDKIDKFNKKICKSTYLNYEEFINKKFNGKNFLKYCIDENENLYGNLSTILIKRSSLSNFQNINGIYPKLYKLQFIISIVLNNTVILMPDKLVSTKIDIFDIENISEEVNEYIELCEELYKNNIIKNIVKVYDNINKNIPWMYMESEYEKFKMKYNSILKKNKIQDKFDKEYDYDYKNKVFIRKNYDYLDYRDGSEEYIYNVFEAEDNITEYPVELAKYIKDWGSQYHLTHVRINLLHCIEELIRKNDKVLELGAGMGASTNWLANKFKTVHCIEGNIHRAKALRERNKYNKNVTVFVDDLNTGNFPEENYSMITLLGVMEYLPFYSDESPEIVCHKLLEKVNRNLAQDGIFTLAIENKMGEKYFAGCTEDHNGRIFSGINGYPEKSPITFSKKELTKILKKSGFKSVKFYFPFPDYKLPQCIIKEDSEISNFNIGAINRANSFEYSGYRESLMMEPLLLNSLNDAGMLFDMANSFLVICSKEEDINLETNYLIRKYFNRGMKEQFHHYSDFIRKGDDYYVDKKVIGLGEKKYKDDTLEFEIKDSKIITGKNIIIDVYKSILIRDNLTSFKKLCIRLREELIMQFSIGKKDDEGYELLKGNSFDFVFNNIIEYDEKWIFIDKKWTINNEIPEDYVVFRAIKNIFTDMGAYIPVFSSDKFIFDIITQIYKQFTNERYKKLCSLEELHLSSIYYGYKNTNIQTSVFEKSLEIKNSVLQSLINK